MKNVLIVSDSPIFREFLKDKLAEKKVSSTVLTDKRDVVIKMSSLLPDLAILEHGDLEDTDYFTEILSHIKDDPNASRIPMIAAGPSVDKSVLASFVKYGIHKYFVKPINFDIFFNHVSKILKTPFIMDTTPCIMDVHRNEDVIFVEIAQGLNRERISLLKYKLAEIIRENEIETPKVVLMLTNLELSFVDGLNIEYLLDNILANSAIHTKNVKILSFCPFVKNLVDGHSEYDGIETATDISQILNSLVNSTTSHIVSDLIADKILLSSDAGTDGCIEVRCNPDPMAKESAEQPKTEIDISALTKKAKIAVVDSDMNSQNFISIALKNAGYDCETFSTGTDFLTKIGTTKYNAIIIDIILSGISGLDTLKRIQGLADKPPIIIYSQTVQKEFVVQALTLGAKQYILKPQKPEVIIQKVKDLIALSQ